MLFGMLSGLSCMSPVYDLCSLSHDDHIHMLEDVFVRKEMWREPRQASRGYIVDS
jgi:hypothetical protein